jgi:hypothetical protein
MSESDEVVDAADYDSEDNSPAHNGAITILRQVLKERKEAVEANPDLIITDLLTQSGIYYEARPRYMAAGINPAKAGKQFRKNQVRKIEKICEEMGVTREEIGIFAQARTFLYFSGEKHSVGFKNLMQLMKMGTDIILIEKEGMAEVLRPFANAAGIAILNSIGFVARYAGRLAELSKKDKAHIAMLTDFDVSGLTISRSFPWIYRIGIDFESLKHLKTKDENKPLTKEDVEEDYDTTKPKKRGGKSAYNHWKGLQNMGPAEGEDAETFYNNLEYLRSKRIEIDSVVRKVGNQEFWDFVVKNLTKKFTHRNYNRSIEVPSYVDPQVSIDLAGALRNKIEELLEVDVQEEIGDLANTKGIIKDIKKRKQAIVNRFQDIVLMDTNLGPILEKMQEITDELNQE